jgi:dTDP-4-amino-4,6-dideoxygalactose transaminase
MPSSTSPGRRRGHCRPRAQAHLRMTTAPPSASDTSTPGFARFAIGFDHRDRERLHALIDEVLDSNRWSEADIEQAASRQAWEAYNEAPAVALSSWAGGALAALHFAGVQGETVLCPSNTFMATALAAIRSGAEVQFVDCNREDLCMSFTDFERKAEQHRPQAPPSSSTSAATSPSTPSGSRSTAREHDIFLIEDCAHAHGGSAGTAAAPARTATRACTRCMRPRRSPRVRAACSSPAALR